MFNSSDELKVSDIADETEIETDNDYLQKVISVLFEDVDTSFTGQLITPSKAYLVGFG